jgi:hypothetical protein
MAGQETHCQGSKESGVVRSIRRNEPLVESEGFFWPSKLEGTLEGEVNERFRCGGLGWKGLPKLQDLVVFGAVEGVCDFSFEGWAG